MDIFNWEEFKEGRLAVQCNTLDKCIDFIEKCKSNNIEFNFNDINDSWNIFKENTTFVYIHADYNYLTLTTKTIMSNNYSININIIEWEI